MLFGMNTNRILPNNSNNSQETQLPVIKFTKKKLDLIE